MATLPLAGQRPPLLERWRRHGPRARLLAVAILLALATVAAFSLAELLPRRHALTISGTDITSNRHFLARALQEAAREHGVALALHPSAGSQEALALVAAGKLDLALVQGGLDLPSKDVVQVATVTAEALHFLVRPGIEDIAGLRGQRINLNTRRGGTRLVARPVLAFAGLREGVDYVESNIPTEQLLALRGERLPGAIVLTSFVPSDVVDYLVRQQGYRLLEIPFASSFALRHDWAVDAEIGPMMYSAAPPVPARAIRTVGVRLCLVAHRGVDDRAIVKVLEALYGPALQARLKMRLDESQILAASAWPPAHGTRLFIDRNKPLFARDLLDRLKAALGLAASLYSMLLVVLKWLRQAPRDAGGAEADTHAADVSTDAAASCVLNPGVAIPGVAPPAAPGPAPGTP